MPVVRFDSNRPRRSAPRASSLSWALQNIVADLQQLEGIVPPAKMAALVTMIHNLLLSWQEPRTAADSPAPGPPPRDWRCSDDDPAAGG